MNLRNYFAELGLGGSTQVERAILSVWDGNTWPPGDILVKEATFIEAMGLDARSSKSEHKASARISDLNKTVLERQREFGGQHLPPCFGARFKGGTVQYVILVVDRVLAERLLTLDLPEVAGKKGTRGKARSVEIAKLVEQFYCCPLKDLYRLGRPLGSNKWIIPRGRGHVKRAMIEESILRLMTGTAGPTDPYQSRVVGLWGLPGVGKTHIARSIAEETAKPSDRAADTEHTKGCQETGRWFREQCLFIHLGPPSISAAIDHKVREFQNGLKDEANRDRFLLVLDDARSAAEVLPFLEVQNTSHCCFLITTQNRRILEDLELPEPDKLSWSFLRVPPMTHDESLSLFAISCGSPPRLCERERNDLVRLCGGIPLVLRMVGAMVCKHPKQATGLRRSLLAPEPRHFRQLRAYLPNYTPTDAFRKGGQSVLFRIIDACVLEFLNEDEQDALLPLAATPNGTGLPFKTLRTIWQLDEDVDAEMLVERFVGLSLIEESETRGVFLLHDMIAAYLVALIGMREAAQENRGLKEYHENILRAYAGQYFERGASKFDNGEEISWWELEDDKYVLEYLPYHLRQAGREAELQALLGRYDWIREKLARCGCASLLADYRLLDESEMDVSVKLVRDALSLSSHVLYQRPKELPTQSYARLLGQGNQNTKRFLEQLHDNTHSPWFRVLTPSLHQVSGALLRTLRGHRSTVNDVAYVKELGIIVSASSDKTVRLWDFATGEEEAVLGRHDKPVNCLCVTSKATLCVSGGDDCRIQLWDLGTRKNLYAIEAEYPIKTVAITNEGDWLVAGDVQGNVVLYALDPSSQSAGLTISTFDSFVKKVLIDGEGGFFAALSDTGELRAWVLDDEFSEVLRDKEKVPSYQDIAWWPTKTATMCLLFAQAPLREKLWCLEVGNAPREIHNKEVYSTVSCMSIGEKLALMADVREWANVIDIKKGTELGALFGHSGPITSVVLTPDESKAITASMDETIKIWDISNPSAFECQADLPPRHSRRITALQAIPRSPFAISASTDNKVWLWNMQTGRRDAVIESSGSVTSVTVAPDGSMFATGSRNGQVCLFSVSNPRLKWIESLGEGDVIGALAFSMTHRGVLAGTDDGSIHWVSLGYRRKLSLLGQHASPITSVTVSSDGTHLLSCSEDKEFKVWSLENRSLARSGFCRHGQPVFLAHENLVVCGADSPIGLEMWPVTCPDEDVRRLSFESFPILSFALLTAHPSKPWVVAAGHHSGELAAWDLAKACRIQEWVGHAGEITGILMSSCGHLVASASKDHTFAVWHIDSPEPVCTFTAESAVCTCCASEDFRTFAVGEESGRVHILHLENV